MAQRINRRKMQRKYMFRRVMLLVIMLGLIGGGGWLLLRSGLLPFGAAEEAADDGTPAAMQGEDPVNPSYTMREASQSEQLSEPEPVAAATTDPNDEWQLRLANSVNALPQGYAPPELESVGDGYQVDSRIAPELKRMIADAKVEGITLLICSAYRPEDYQTGLYENKVQEHINYGYGEEEARAAAATIVALPGTSEHQTGLAVDIVTPSYQTLDDGYADTPAAKWLKENAWKYGFILRYPEDKQSITNIIFEPWHYRYVGVEHATIIHQKSICLEEYLTQYYNQPEGINVNAAVGDDEDVPEEGSILDGLDLD